MPDAAPKRYLRMDLHPQARRQGSRRVLHHLWQFLGIASALDRIPIVDNELRLSAAHNGGAEPQECDPRTYRDLDSAVRYGDGLPLEGLPLEYIMRSQADAAGLAESDAMRVAMNADYEFSTERKHQEHPLLVLDATGYKNVPSSISASGLTGGRRHAVQWLRSPRLVSMADEVIREMMAKSSGYPEMRNYSEHLHSGVEGNYCCVHSRRGDLLTVYWRRFPYARAATDPGRVMRLMDGIAEVTPDSVVYLMTDERNPAYAGAFKRRYRNLWTYKDFPQLRALREGPSPNNYLLYDVERLIHEQANVSISTRRARRRMHIVETHRVVRVPLLMAAARHAARILKHWLLRTPRGRR